MSRSHRPAGRDVAVVGGGVVGLTVAWSLARRGHRVTTYDPAPARGASWAAAGMLSPAGEAWYGEEALLRVGVASLARWPDMAAALERDAGRALEVRGEGTLLAAATEDDAREQERVTALLDTHTIPYHPLTRREVRAREPALHPALRAVVEIPGDRSVHNRTLLAALLAACARRHVTAVDDAVDLVRDGDTLHVRTRQDGRARGHDVVVLANGVGLRTTEGAPEWLRDAVRPVKGEILRLHAPRPMLARTVRAAVRGRPVYLVPRNDGEIVVGATMLERGYDTTVTVEGVHDLLHDAVEVVPELRDCAFVEAAAGLRPSSSDHLPLVGATGIPGLLVAAGHHRGGVLLAPWTADVITALVEESSPPEGSGHTDPLRLSPTLQEAR